MRVDGKLERDIVLRSPLVMDGKEYKSIIIREVIGTDEEYVSQPNFKTNPVLMICSLITRCIAEVPEANRLPRIDDIKKMPAGITDEILLEIRDLSIGKVIEIKPMCPSCKKEFDETRSLDELRGNGDFSEKKITLQRGILTKDEEKKELIIYDIVVSPLTGEDQEKFLRKKDFSRYGENTTELAMYCCKDKDGNKFSQAQVSEMARVDRKMVSEAMRSFEHIKTLIDVTCQHCGFDFSAQINMLDFLY